MAVKFTGGNYPKEGAEYYTKAEVDSAISGSSTLPTGGTISQVLTKNSSTNGDVSWKDGTDIVPGTGIDNSTSIVGGVQTHIISVDLTELNSSTTNADGTYFVVTTSSPGSQKRLAKGSINISEFNPNSLDLTGDFSTDGTAKIGGTAIVSGVTYRYQPTPTTLTAPVNRALTTTELLSGIILHYGIGSSNNMTLPTGAAVEAAVAANLPNNTGFEWSIINFSTNAIGLGNAESGNAYVGYASISTNTVARFLTRKTTTNTYITYRIA